MSGKFIKFKRVALSFLTIALISSQLMGCGAATSDELLQAVNSGQAIEIVVEVPDNVENGTEQELTWVQLDKLDTYSEFRRNFEDALFITSFGADSKNGVCYTDLEGNHEGNNTLYNGFANNKFRLNYWENAEVQEKVQGYAAEQFVDVEVNTTASKVVALNAYYNILPDADPNYFNGDSLLTRAEFMSAIFRAENQVTDIEADTEFEALVGKNEYTVYASALAKDSYLDLESKSLNDRTFNGTMTRGEALYMLMSHYYGSDLANVDVKAKSKSGIKNAGNVAEKQGYTGDYGRSYELVFCIQNADKGAPEQIYKAIELAYEKGILEEGEQVRWEEGITKEEGLDALTRVYMSFSSQIAVDRGAGQEVEEVNLEEELNEVYKNEEGVSVDALGVNGEVTEDEYDELRDNEDTEKKEETSKKEDTKSEETTKTEDTEKTAEIPQSDMDDILDALYEDVYGDSGNTGHIEGNPPPEGATDSTGELPPSNFGSSGINPDDAKYQVQ